MAGMTAVFLTTWTVLDQMPVWSPPMRQLCATSLPHSHGFSRPHSHMLKWKWRPLALSAWDMAA